MAAKASLVIVYNHLPALIAAVEANSRSAPKRVADRIAQTAKGLAPVDTGALRDSIVSVSIESGKKADVMATAEYAPYVEMGTYKMAAQPFLYPATQQHAEEFFAEIMTPLFDRQFGG